MKRFILTLIAVFASVVFSNTVFAENFYIENYNVDLKVNEDRSVRVTEDIDVKFTRPSHGIFRTIPHKNATISNIGVNEMYSRSFSNSETTIKIGNPDKLVTGLHNYRIDYTYTMYDNNLNEFYFNIIGTEWPVEIKQARFHVTMPNDFDFAKAGLSVGKYGVRGFDGTAKYWKDGINALSGETTASLAPYNGITLRIEVPDGYFIKASINDKARIVFAGIIILTLISFGIWFKYGKDEHITPIVSFYPPKGLNSIDAEIVYKEKATTKSLVALLIELAGKGYVLIEEDKNRLNNFFIKKAKEYDGNNSVERTFLNNIFSVSDSVNLRNLQYSKLFYQDCAKLVDFCNKKKNNVYEESSLSLLNKTIISICTLGIIMLTLLGIFNFDISYLFSNGILLLFPIFAIFILIKTKINPFIIVWAAGFGGMPLLIILSSVVFANSTFIILGIGIVGTIISSICLKQLAKKNIKGQRIMAHLLGLKKFIDVAEKNRLKSLINQNPQYYYNILPYAYILDVSNDWIKRFEGIAMENPNWYKGKNFSLHFNNFASNMLSATIPTTANGGISTSSSGGGGHCGGGGGGGGGGSW